MEAKLMPTKITERQQYVHHSTVPEAVCGRIGIALSVARFERLPTGLAKILIAFASFLNARNNGEHQQQRDHYR